MPKMLQFGVVTFKNYNKGEQKTIIGSHIQVMCQKTQLNEPTTWSKYPTLLYAMNQMTKKIIYKGQVFNLDH